MKSLTAFRLTQGFYWLGLGTWVGAVAMLIIAAVLTFRTVRVYRPTLGVEPYNHPALADRAAPILAGGTVGAMIKGLAVVELSCAGVIGVCVLLQCTVFSSRLSGGIKGIGNLLRILLIAGSVAVVIAQVWCIGPGVWRERTAMYDMEQDASVREAARLRFDRLHKISERATGTSGLMLIGAVLVSAFVLHGEDGRREDAAETTSGSTV